MLHNHFLATRLCLCLITATVSVSAARAEDFNFEVPVEIDIATVGATRITVRIGCGVFSNREPDGILSGLIGSEVVTVEIDPDTGRLRTTLPFHFNADIAVHSTRARYYECGFGATNYHYGTGAAGLAVNPSTLESDYERVTGFSLTRVVPWVRGEIPRTE